MGEGIGEYMSKYKENLISLLPYGRKVNGYKGKGDGKGHIIVHYKNGKKKKTLKFDEEAGVIL